MFKSFFRSDCSILYSLQKYIDSPNAILLSILGIVGLFDVIHSDSQVVIIHCCFISLMTSDNEHLYRCLLAICIYFCKVLTEIFCSFLNWISSLLMFKIEDLFFRYIYIMDVAFQSGNFLFRYFKDQNFQFNKIQFIDFSFIVFL